MSFRVLIIAGSLTVAVCAAVAVTLYQTLGLDRHAAPRWSDEPGDGPVTSGDFRAVGTTTSDRDTGRPLAARASGAVPAPRVTPGRSETAISTAEIAAPLPNPELLVRVSDGKHEPIKEALVVLRGARKSIRERTDVAGLARFQDLAPATYGLTIEAPEFPALQSSSPVSLQPGQVRELSLVLGSYDLGISGRALDADGRPVGNVEISAVPLQKGEGTVVLQKIAGLPLRTTTTAEEGRFVLTDLADGEYTLVARHGDAYSSSPRRVIAPAEGIDLVLFEEATVVVYGVVTDPKGFSLERARIAARPSGQSVETDGEGAYRLMVTYTDSPNTVLFVSAAKQGFSSARKRVFPEKFREVEELELSFQLEPLEELAAVVGWLTDRMGHPVAGERVHLRSEKLNTRYSTPSDENGSFAFPAVKPSDDYMLWIYPQGSYRDYTVHSQVVELGENQVDITLDPIGEGSLRALLRDGEGTPLPQFTVRLRSPQSLARSQSVTSDDSGIILAESVPEGPLIIETQAHPRVNVQGLRIDRDQELAVEIPTGVGVMTVSGSVLDADGEPVAGAQVIVKWTEKVAELTSSVTHESVSDESGGFTLNGLASGQCSVTVIASGFRPRRQSFAIESAAEGPGLEIRLEPNSPGESRP